MITMKESLQIAQQFAPHTKRVNQDIRHGIPAAQHMSPEVAAARVQKSGAGQLFDALSGFATQAIKTNDTHAKVMQDKALKEMQKREMSPEEFGQVADRSNLPYQWNPVFMKMYDKGLGEKFARDHYTSSFEEVMNAEDVYTLSEEQFTERVIQGVKKRAGESGLDPASETQMLAFSNTLNPAVSKGTANFIAQKSQVLGKAAQQDRIASIVSTLKGTDMANPEMASMAVQKLQDETVAQLGMAKGREAFTKAVDVLAKNGDIDQLEAIRGIRFGNTTLEELYGGWDMVKLQASNARHSLGMEADNAWRTQTYDMIETAETEEELMGHLNTAPEAQRSRIPEYLRQWKNNREAKRVAVAREATRQYVDKAATNLGTEAWNLIKGGQVAVWSDHQIPGTDEKGNPLVIKSADVLGQAQNMAINEMNATLMNPELSSGQRAELLSNMMKQASRFPDGGKNIYNTAVKGLLDMVEVTTSDATAVERMASGHIPQGFQTALEALNSMRHVAPESIPQDKLKLANGIFNLVDAGGMNPLEAARVFAQGKHNPVAADPKVTKKLTAELSAMKLSGEQLAANAGAVDTLLKAGRTHEEITSILQKGDAARFYPEVDLGNHLGKLPRNAVKIDQGYEGNFSQWNSEYLTEVAGNALRNQGLAEPASAVRYEYGERGVTLNLAGRKLHYLPYGNLQDNFETRRVAHLEGIRVKGNAEVTANAAAKKRREGTVLGDMLDGEGRNTKSGKDADKRTREAVANAQKRNGGITEFSVPTLDKTKKRRNPNK